MSSQILLTSPIILLSHEQAQPPVLSSRLNRWNSSERNFLFPELTLSKAPKCSLPGCLPRIGNNLDLEIWGKLFSSNQTLASAYFTQDGKGVTYYSRKVNSFLQILDFVPTVRDGQGNLRPPSEFKTLTFMKSWEADAVCCLLNSSLFRWFIDVVSDGSHLNKRELDFFPFDPRLASDFSAQFTVLATHLSSDLKKNSFDRIMAYKHDTLTVQCIVPKRSKAIIDDIDRVLARYYSLSDEQLDYIINYDIKYRMGLNGGEADADE